MPAEPVISVDGFWNAPGLNLSHWPGHQTPKELRHELSTGAALAFVRLPEQRQRELAGDAVAIVNNHDDTDGVCSLFSLRYPDLALPRADALLRAAAAGDFYKAADEDALAIDAVVEAFADVQRSPIADELRGLEDTARHERAALALLELLPAMLDGELEPYRDLWGPAVERYRADCTDLAGCARDDIVHLDLTIWTAPAGARSSGSQADLFDPSRHALYGDTDADRVLVIAPRGAGATYRFVIGTRSWFDLPGRAAQARPDVRALARRLDELEGTRPTEASAWRTQGALGASPELWFGAAELESFSDHNPSLAPSRLAPERVRREVADALRAVLVLQ